MDLTFLDHKRDTVTPQSARAMSLNKRSLLPHCLENWEVQGNSASSWPASWWLLPCPHMMPGKNLMSLPLQTLIISDKTSQLGAHLTLILYFQSTPLPSIVTMGVGVQHWNFEESVQSLYLMFSLLEFVFFKDGVSICSPWWPQTQPFCLCLWNAGVLGSIAIPKKSVLS